MALAQTTMVCKNPSDADKSMKAMKSLMMWYLEVVPFVSLACLCVPLHASPKLTFEVLESTHEILQLTREMLQFTHCWIALQRVARAHRLLLIGNVLNKLICKSLRVLTLQGWPEESAGRPRQQCCHKPKVPRHYKLRCRFGGNLVRHQGA